jgi:hypothetical protein
MLQEPGKMMNPSFLTELRHDGVNEGVARPVVVSKILKFVTDEEVKMS